MEDMITKLGENLYEASFNGKTFQGDYEDCYMFLATLFNHE